MRLSFCRPPSHSSFNGDGKGRQQNDSLADDYGRHNDRVCLDALVHQVDDVDLPRGQVVDVRLDYPGRRVDRNLGHPGTVKVLTPHFLCC